MGEVKWFACDRGSARARGGDELVTGLVVVHPSSRPARGIGGGLPPCPRPFGEIVVMDD